jgi:preprotein translocase subunit SecD
LLFVLVVLIGLYAGLFFGDGGHARTPLLGIDLRGGTTVTLTAQPISGSNNVTRTQLNEAVNIIRDRVNGAGVSGGVVQPQGSNEIVVTVPGQGRNILDVVERTALLSFRQVLIEPGAPTTTTQTVAPSPGASGSPSSGTTIKTTATAKAKSSGTSGTAHSKGQGDVLRPALLRKHGAGKSPAHSTSATPAATVVTSPSPSGSASGSTSPTPTSSGSAISSGSASAVPTPSPSSSGPPVTQQGDILMRGKMIVASPKLSDVQSSYATFNCASVGGNPTNGIDIPGDYELACATDGVTKYLLAPAAVTPSWPTGGVLGSQVSSASSGLLNGQYQVLLNFRSTGSGQWLKVTAAAAKETNPPASQGCSTTGLGCNAVAVVLDGIVQTAPTIQAAGGIAGGQAQITGGFTQASAASLATILNYGSLPLKLDPGQAESISPTLGSSQLRGGLVAGVISLILVALFCLIYYRALGLVAIASLGLSGLVLYAVTTMLGHSSLGYTLSLAGIAGFIVAVGITADSFVVFFERLRDEVREGKRLRSGVERAWPRARRTILSADTVSLLAAVVLYLVSISDVRGFAFTLGLSTLSDLFIVFLFTKPLLTLLARRPAFDRGARWTGIARDRGARRPAGSTVGED